VQIRSQDVASFVVATASLSPDRTDAAWDYLIAHAAEYKKVFGGTPSDQTRVFEAMLAEVAQSFSTRARARDVLEYFGAPGASEGDLQAYAQDTLSSIRERIWLRDGLVPGACAYLANATTPMAATRDANLQAERAATSGARAAVGSFFATGWALLAVVMVAPSLV
jgi:hypothetical protein